MSTRKSGLCITRRATESIVVSTTVGDIEIIVTKVRGKQVTLLVVTPDKENFRIHRGETMAQHQEQSDVPECGAV